MRSILSVTFVLVIGLGMVQAKPVKKQTKDEPTTPKEKPGAFKPIDINNELDANDPKDELKGHPSKRYTVKLVKGKSYVIDLISEDFDAYLGLLDKDGKVLAVDDDGGDDLNSRILHSADRDGDYTIVVTSFDNQVGKFNLKVVEVAAKREGKAKIQGEAKPREVGKNGITINGQINQNDAIPVGGKVGKVYSVQLKKGQTYQFDQSSNVIDSYLVLVDANGNVLAQDDDSGGNLDARISFRAPADGVFHIIATTFGGRQTGEFTLNVAPTAD